jgi:hypothetical protein
MDRSTSLVGDCRAVREIATVIPRAFRDDFVATPDSTIDLSDHLGTAFQRLVDAIYLRRRNLEDRSLGLRPNTAFRVRRSIDRCDAHLSRAFRSGNGRRLSRHLTRAARALETGARIADDDAVK